MRIGIGYDIHPLVKGRKLILGGVTIPFEKGLKGHSDADALYHAVTDALLGAIGNGDIGTYFSDTDPRWKGKDSAFFLTETMSLVEKGGYRVANVDTILILEEPRLSPYKCQMIENLARLLKIKPDDVNVKAKTNEKLGAIGRGEGIAAQAVVLLEKR